MINRRSDGWKKRSMDGRKDSRQQEEQTEQLKGQTGVSAGRRTENVRGEGYLFSEIRGHKMQVNRLIPSAFISVIKPALEGFKTTLRFAPTVIQIQANVFHCRFSFSSAWCLRTTDTIDIYYNVAGKTINTHGRRNKVHNCWLQEIPTDYHERPHCLIDDCILMFNEICK